jgi:probable F420-dependent oxidoreductase
MGVLSELGCYGLAGHSSSPRDILGEARRAEELGIGSMFLSERFTTKDAPTLSGAVGAVTERLGIASGATNHNTRHPMVTATYATTMHKMTEGRFALGLGRGFDFLFDVMGLPRITMAQMEDAVGILRTLWSGGTVVGHEGPAGNFPYLFQDPTSDMDIPVLFTAMGGKTLEFAGRVADGVILHTFFTDETLARSVAAIRKGAADAGKDPASVRVWAVLVTATDHIPEEQRLRKLVGRLATYLQGYGDLLVRVNGWDPAVLETFRADPLVAGYQGAFDAIGTTEELAHVASLLPDSWLGASATGTPEACARRIGDQLAAGADGVILHGATPDELAPVLAAYREIRPVLERYGSPSNPGKWEIA